MAVAKKKRLSREEQKANRAKELLTAAWELFCEQGYESLTIDVIAEHAGYSRMPVYSLFGDKQNLFFELWRTMSADVSFVLLHNCQPGAPLSANLRQVASNLMATKQTDNRRPGEQLFFVVQTVSINRPDIREKLDALANEHIQQIADMIAHSTPDQGQQLRASPEVIAKHLIAYINGSGAVEFHTHHTFQTEDDVFAILMAMALQPA